jgi:amidohydrolase
MFSSDPEFLQWLVTIRRDIHRHPEISHEERLTTQKIVEILEGLTIEVRTFPKMTGALGLIRGSSGKRTIALRADIDALPIVELNDVPYKSQCDGIMHACGHDANTTIMLGVAKKIIETGLSSKIEGNVKLIFQPGEEKGTGAKALIAEGVLENPRIDCVFAGHMSPDLPVGTVGVFKGQGYALADRFELIITGKGAHGGRPEEGIDPIVAGSYFVTQIQSIVSRNVGATEAAVVTVGKFDAGNAANVIPESAHLEGTIRTLSSPIRKKVIQRLKEMTSGIERAFKVKCAFKLHEGLPSCVNDEEMAAFLHDVSKGILGPDNVSYLPPIMGAEDFAYYALERPSAIMRLGCSDKKKGIIHPLHSPSFDIDEKVLEIGVAIFYEAVRKYLSADSV